MKILATSDLHGNVPKVPKCDIFIIAGDICPMDSHNLDWQLTYLDQVFAKWLRTIPARHIIGIAGNHDFIFEHRSHVDNLYLPWIYLQDEGAEVAGIKFYGIPWVPNLPNWAFHQDKEGLALRYNAVPKDTDIVISHGPPHTYGDRTSPMHGDRNVGPKSAVDMINRVRPEVYICGHIHEGFGHYRHQPQHGNPTDIYNVAYVDEWYTPRDRIIEIPWGDDVNSDAPETPANIISQIRDSDPSDGLTPEPLEGSGTSSVAVD